MRRDHSLGVIELTFRGPTARDDLREATSKCIILGKQAATTKFLVDATAIDLIASLLDLYDLPAKQYEEEEADRLSCVALILPTSEEAREALRFYETACKNRGWNVQVFSEKQGAIDWLMGKVASKKPDAGDG